MSKYSHYSEKHASPSSNVDNFYKRSLRTITSNHLICDIIFIKSISFNSWNEKGWPLKEYLARVYVYTHMYTYTHTYIHVYIYVPFFQHVWIIVFLVIRVQTKITTIFIVVSDNESKKKQERSFKSVSIVVEIFLLKYLSTRKDIFQASNYTAKFENLMSYTCNNVFYKTAYFMSREKNTK